MLNQEDLNLYLHKLCSCFSVIDDFVWKMSRQCLRGIRLETKTDPDESIFQYVDEINEVYVPYKWKFKMKIIDLENENIFNIVYEVLIFKVVLYEKNDKEIIRYRRNLKNKNI